MFLPFIISFLSDENTFNIHQFRIKPDGVCENYPAMNYIHALFNVLPHIGNT